jgi:t-SNARE complex subunit (syntaxin)
MYPLHTTGPSLWDSIQNLHCGRQQPSNGPTKEGDWYACPNENPFSDTTSHPLRIEVEPSHSNPNGTEETTLSPSCLPLLYQHIDNNKKWIQHCDTVDISSSSIPSPSLAHSRKESLDSLCSNERSSAFNINELNASLIKLMEPASFEFVQEFIPTLEYPISSSKSSANGSTLQDAFLSPTLLLKSAHDQGDQPSLTSRPEMNEYPVPCSIEYSMPSGLETENSFHLVDDETWLRTSNAQFQTIELHSDSTFLNLFKLEEKIEESNLTLPATDFHSQGLLETDSKSTINDSKKQSLDLEKGFHSIPSRDEIEIFDSPEPFMTVHLTRQQFNLATDLYPDDASSSGTLSSLANASLQPSISCPTSSLFNSLHPLDPPGVHSGLHSIPDEFHVLMDRLNPQDFAASEQDLATYMSSLTDHGTFPFPVPNKSTQDATPSSTHHGPKSKRRQNGKNLRSTHSKSKASPSAQNKSCISRDPHPCFPLEGKPRCFADTAFPSEFGAPGPCSSGSIPTSPTTTLSAMQIPSNKPPRCRRSTYPPSPCTALEDSHRGIDQRQHIVSQISQSYMSNPTRSSRITSTNKRLFENSHIHLLDTVFSEINSSQSINVFREIEMNTKKVSKTKPSRHQLVCISPSSSEDEAEYPEYPSETDESGRINKEYQPGATQLRESRIHLSQFPSCPYASRPLPATSRKRTPSGADFLLAISTEQQHQGKVTSQRTTGLNSEVQIISQSQVEISRKTLNSHSEFHETVSQLPNEVSIELREENHDNMGAHGISNPIETTTTRTVSITKRAAATRAKKRMQSQIGACKSSVTQHVTTVCQSNTTTTASLREYNHAKLHSGERRPKKTKKLKSIEANSTPPFSQPATITNLTPSKRHVGSPSTRGSLKKPTDNSKSLFPSNTLYPWESEFDNPSSIGQVIKKSSGLKRAQTTTSPEIAKRPRTSPNSVVPSKTPVHPILESRLVDPAYSSGNRQCYNCGTCHTASWRRSKLHGHVGGTEESGQGAFLCNPCGL